MAGLIDDIPAGFRVFLAWAVQAVVVVDIVAANLANWQRIRGGFAAVAPFVYGAGGPPLVLLVMTAAALLARRTRAATGTATLVVLCAAVAAVQLAVAIAVSVGDTLRPLPVPVPVGLVLVEECATLGFTVLILAFAVALCRYPPGPAAD